MNQLYKYFGPEDFHGKELAEHIRFYYPDLFWWHTPNEGRRTNLQQLKIRDLGIRSGVSDILAISDLPGHKGLCLELKADKRKPTDNQLEFLRRMSDCGWQCHVSGSIETSRQIVDDWVHSYCSARIWGHRCQSDGEPQRSKNPIMTVDEYKKLISKK